MQLFYPKLFWLAFVYSIIPELRTFQTSLVFASISHLFIFLVLVHANTSSSANCIFLFLQCNWIHVNFIRFRIFFFHFKFASIWYGLPPVELLSFRGIFHNSSRIRKWSSYIACLCAMRAKCESCHTYVKCHTKYSRLYRRTFFMLISHYFLLSRFFFQITRTKLVFSSFYTIENVIWIKLYKNFLCKKLHTASDTDQRKYDRMFVLCFKSQKVSWFLNGVAK